MSYQGTSPQIGTHKKLDNLAFDGVTTSFVLSAFGSPVFPAIAEALLISLNGVLQEPNGSFTVSGSNITFSSAPAIGTSFFGVLLGEKVLLADVLAASGGTMTGLLTLSANPTAALGAATKQYVDSGVSSVSTAKQDVLVSGTNIKTINGASVLGSGNLTVSSNSALVLLASLSPTAAANIDFLTLFSSTYDDYLIIGNGIKFAADDGVRLQFANAGVIDVVGNFWQTTANIGAGGTALAVATVTTGTLRTAGLGANFEIFTRNVNSASSIKSAHITSTWQSTVGGTTDYTSLEYMTVYSGGSVSGFRLTSSFGANFAAQGSIKVYGIAKA